MKWSQFYKFNIKCLVSQVFSAELVPCWKYFAISVHFPLVSHGIEGILQNFLQNSPGITNWLPPHHYHHHSLQWHLEEVIVKEAEQLLLFTLTVESGKKKNKNRKNCTAPIIMALTTYENLLSCPFPWKNLLNGPPKVKFKPGMPEVLLEDQKADQPIEIQHLLNGDTLSPNTQVHSLRVFLEAPLSLDAQVSAVAKRMFVQLKLLCQPHPLLERSDLAMLTPVLVTSHLHYCNRLMCSWWEDGLETPSSPKCCSQTVDWSWLVGLCDLLPPLQQLHWLLVYFWTLFKMLLVSHTG